MIIWYQSTKVLRLVINLKWLTFPVFSNQTLPGELFLKEVRLTFHKFSFPISLFLSRVSEVWLRTHKRQRKQRSWAHRLMLHFQPMSFLNFSAISLYKPGMIPFVLTDPFRNLVFIERVYYYSMKITSPDTRPTPQSSVHIIPHNRRVVESGEG